MIIYTQKIMKKMIEISIFKKRATARDICFYFQNFVMKIKEKSLSPISLKLRFNKICHDFIFF